MAQSASMLYATCTTYTLPSRKRTFGIRRYELTDTPSVALHASLATRIRLDKTVCYGHPAGGTLIARNLAHGVPYLLTSLRTQHTRQHTATPFDASHSAQCYALASIKRSSKLHPYMLYFLEEVLKQVQHTFLLSTHSVSISPRTASFLPHFVPYLRPL